MNQLKAKVKNVLQLSFSRMIDGETREWPPKCLAFAYQPQRPKVNCNTSTTADVSTQKRNKR